MARIHAVALLILATVLPACGEPEPAPRERSLQERLVDLGAERYAGIEPNLTERSGEWDVHTFPVDKARCLDGSPFKVSVREAQHYAVLLYLEGGGACWDEATCHGSRPMTKRSASAIPLEMRDTGILNRYQPTNQYVGASVVHASYCDGSMWLGDQDVTYGETLTYHRGLANVSAAVDTMKRRFPHPSVIILAGSSAGGYGTMSAYVVARNRYPGTPIVIFNDSGPWLLNADKHAMYSGTMENWPLAPLLPNDCAGCDTQPIHLARWVLDRDPGTRIALFSYRDDRTMAVDFLGLGDSYRPLLEQTSDAIHAAHPDRFKRFFVDGTGHTVLLTLDYYQISRDGQLFSDWSNKLLAGSAAWVDRP